MTKALLLLFIFFFSSLTSLVSAAPGSPYPERKAGKLSIALRAYGGIALASGSFEKNSVKSQPNHFL